MKTKKTNGKKSISKKIGLIAVVLVPFISFLAVIMFRYFYIPNNEEILEKMKNLNGYKANVSYTIINTQGKYEEETTQYYSKQYGTRVEFGQERVKIYKDGSINIKENKGNDEYEMAADFDSFYTLAFLNNILKDNYTSIKEGQEEWGDIKYLEIDFNIDSKNNHIATGKVYIDKSKFAPIVLKIYDNKAEEKAIIKYKDFEILKDVDKDLF